MSNEESCPVTGKPCEWDVCEVSGRCHESGNNLDRATARTDPVINRVCAELQGRSQFGIAKYGTTLDENRAEHIDKLKHILYELMDATNYTMWAIMEIEKRREAKDADGSPV